MTSSNSNWKNKACSIIMPQKRALIVHQYRKSFGNVVETGTLTAAQLIEIQDHSGYYYKVEPYNDRPFEKQTDIHFGVRVTNDGSNEFDLGIYANQLLNMAITICTAPEELLDLMNRNLSFHRDALRELSELTLTGLNKELSVFLDRYQFFSEVDDLRTVQACPGLYLMVLDDYACCYIGQSKDIKKRIQHHWSKTNFSTTGIDMFKALDTSRIFVVCTDKDITQDVIDRLEYLFIHSINRKYLLNTFGGGGSLEFIHSDSPDLGYTGRIQ